MGEEVSPVLIPRLSLSLTSRYPCVPHLRRNFLLRVACVSSPSLVVLSLLAPIRSLSTLSARSQLLLLTALSPEPCISSTMDSTVPSTVCCTTTRTPRRSCYRRLQLLLPSPVLRQAPRLSGAPPVMVLIVLSRRHNCHPCLLGRRHGCTSKIWAHTRQQQARHSMACQCRTNFISTVAAAPTCATLLSKPSTRKNCWWLYPAELVHSGLA